MNSIKKIVIFISLMVISSTSFSSDNLSSLKCKKNAIIDAKKFLIFYKENDDRIVIDNNVKSLPKINNPENRNQIFDVLETWGYIYKGKYRIRLTYSSSLNCTLMGEDILEYADL
ncbi:hypothetical protein HGT71_07380 [Rosenbergiella epipactidis]|uniref:hypothetical protein n=1 Tax=Rosenbergiella TaxID=1356488 RepID=UPI001BD94817|nr:MULTISPECIES: hypothetical protein [Rosenbergiella]MBT0718090.1 hypothetical protein [Rosenbergiella epipactidis]